MPAACRWVTTCQASEMGRVGSNMAAPGVPALEALGLSGRHCSTSARSPNPIGLSPSRTSKRPAKRPWSTGSSTTEMRSSATSWKPSHWRRFRLVVGRKSSVPAMRWRGSSSAAPSPSSRGGSPRSPQAAPGERHDGEREGGKPGGASATHAGAASHGPPRTDEERVEVRLGREGFSEGPSSTAVERDLVDVEGRSLSSRRPMPRMTSSSLPARCSAVICPVICCQLVVRATPAPLIVRQRPVGPGVPSRRKMRTTLPTEPTLAAFTHAPANVGSVTALRTVSGESSSVNAVPEVRVSSAA